MLLQNEEYVLPPIKATWSKQQDKQHNNKKVHENTPRCKGMCCAKRKAKLELERINNKKAKKNGDFFKHGHAFATANESSNVVVVVERNVTTNITFAMGTDTNTIPVCKWCSRPGHSYCSSNKCGKNKYVLAALAAAAAEKTKEAEK